VKTGMSGFREFPHRKNALCAEVEEFIKLRVEVYLVSWPLGGK